MQSYPSIFALFIWCASLSVPNALLGAGFETKMIEISELKRMGAPVTVIASNYLGYLSNDLTKVEAGVVYKELSRLYAFAQPKDRSFALALQFADKALDSGLEKDAECDLFLMKGNILAAQRRETGGLIGRRDVASAYLHALRIVTTELRVDKPVEIPAVPMMNLISLGKEDVFRAEREEHELQVKARVYAEQQNSYLGLQHVLFNKFQELYAGDEADELKVINSAEHLKIGSQVLEQIISRIKGSRVK